MASLRTESLAFSRHLLQFQPEYRSAQTDEIRQGIQQTSLMGHEISRLSTTSIHDMQYSVDRRVD